MKKLISIALVAFMLLGMLPMAAFAEDTNVAQAAVAPTIDGSVDASGYAWQSQEFVRAPGADLTVEDTFYTFTPQGGLLNFPVQFFASYDEDYLYLAYKMGSTVHNTIIFDVNPGLGDKQISFKIFTECQDGKTYDLLSDVGTTNFNATSYSATDAGTALDREVYVADAKYSTYVNNAVYHQAELKISRAALATFAGIDSFDTIGLRVNVGHGGNGSYIFANPNSTYKAWSGNNEYGFHEMSLTDGAPTIVAPEVEEPIVTAPTINGSVDAYDEYGWQSQEFVRNSGENLTVENTFYTITAHTQNGSFPAQFFASYDEDYLYLAYKVTNSLNNTVIFDVNPGLKDKQLSFKMFAGCANGSFGFNDLGDSNRNVTSYSASDTGTKLTTADYIEDMYYTAKSDGTWITHQAEFKISRAALATFAGIESFDTIGLRVSVGTDGEYLFANEDSPYKAWSGNNEYGFHEMSLTNNAPTIIPPEIEEPEIDGPKPPVPTIDASSNANEYAWKSQEFVRAPGADLTVEDTFYTFTPQGGLINFPVQFFASYDEDYLYLAYKMGGTFHNTIIFDVNPGLGDKQISFKIFTECQDGKTYDLLSDVGTTNFNATSYSATDAGTALDREVYVADAKYSTYVNNAVYHQAELKISRAALATFAGIDSFDTIGLRVNVGHGGNGSYIFANPNSTYKAWSGNNEYGFHVIELVDCKGNHSYGDLSYDETNHSKTCTACSAVLSEAHTWSEEISTVDAALGVVGYKYKKCTFDGCEAIHIIEGSKQTIDSNANAEGKTQYTLWQNNILQCAIKENGTVYGDEGFLINTVKPTARYREFYASISAAMPDIIALQECDLGWHDLLDNIGGVADAEGVDPISELSYALVIAQKTISVTTTKGTYEVDCRRGIRNPIYYNTTVFELVDSGVVAYGSDPDNYYENPWAFTWAVLKSKTADEYVAVTSTHVPVGAGQAANRLTYLTQLLEKVQEIEYAYNIGVISVGDYNSLMTEEAPSLLNTAMKVAREDALVGKNLEYNTASDKCGEAPEVATDEVNIQIDHCFYSEDGIAGDEWDVMIDKCSYSDHIPALFTFRIYSFNHTCAYDNNCDAYCNVCGAERTTADHVYDNACDADCNVCGATRTAADHVYDNECDADCNVCGATRTVAGHVYDNACDAACNVCGATRTVADHVYENACDADCNECGATRTAADHVYDNACDADCNVCGATRTTTHTPAEDDGDCTTAVNCTVCGTVTTEAKAAHTPAEDDGDCTTAVKCTVCGTVLNPATGAHSYDAQSYSNVTDDTHTKTCSVCSTPVTESHSYVDGACACGKTEACEESTSNVIIKDEGSTAIDISGICIIKEAEKVISVNLSWEIPTFTYTVKRTWNSEISDYELDSNSSGWSEEPAKITVVNNSNQALTASFAFTDTIESSVLVGKFTESNDVAAVGITSVVLDSAETNHEAVTDTVYFYIIDGELPEDHVTGDTIGNITITIGAAN